MQDSAYPYHDWNERVSYECYAPNAGARVLDGDGKVARLANNYGRMSFNFGPTLLWWLQPNLPWVYEAVLSADRESRKRFGGHGSAMAQCYSHMIMPLANPRDRRTQVAWGIRDFSSRFGRAPEGMWLPETAVDTPTLEALAEQGIKFTVLAPRQARAVRPIGSARWKDVSGERIDTHRAYRKRLPSGRSIALFFYDGAIARAVAFEGLLHSGDAFADRLLGGFDQEQHRPQLVHIATDGETYGHHHRHGEMALAYATKRLEESGKARLTVYGEFLERNPPADEVEIVEESSWSCEHGIERWRSDCGCKAGRHPAWTQGWRGPLRSALDWLRDEVALMYEADAATVFEDPWTARDAYIDVVLDRSHERIGRFLEEHAAGRRGGRKAERALKLMELQRQAMLMYTSCGWFFEEISGIETVQVMQYAGRVLQLTEDLLGVDLEPGFLARLEQAASNVPEEKDGRSIFVKWVRPAEVSLRDVAAHYALSSLIEGYDRQMSIYCYEVTREKYESKDPGPAKAAIGRATVKSKITGESLTVDFGAVSADGRDVRAWVRENARKAPASAATESDPLSSPGVRTRTFDELVRAFDDHFGAGTACGITSLFRDERRKVIERSLDSAVTDSAGLFSTAYRREAPLMRFLVSLGSPLPAPFRNAAELFLNASLRSELSANGDVSLERLRSIVDEAARLGLAVDSDGLRYRLAGRLREAMRRLLEAPLDPANLDAATRAVALARGSPVTIDLWEAQYVFDSLASSALPPQRRAASAGDRPAGRWVVRFEALGRDLSMRAG